MKISISYPPLKSKKGVPLLGQNRQFQWFNSPTYIYPVIPASAATLLKQKGYSVLWDDGIAEELTYKEWEDRIKKEKPDLILMETKTPVVKKHWRIINRLKARLDWPVKIALVGDHATALPEESLKYSQVDFVLCGGDYDFGVAELADFLARKKKLEAGWYWREAGVWRENLKNEDINWRGGGFEQLKIKNSGSKQNYHLNDLNALPMIDRQLTKWHLYAYKNGNFKFTPGAYLMSGRDCWWGRCTFCSWTTLFHGSSFRTRSAKLALDEVGELIELGVKEIMEDSGSLPVGPWLKEFCEGMIERGYNKKVTMSCNMRITGIKSKKEWQLMKRAGFRFVLFGLESANQATLDRIDKNLKVEEIEPGLRRCKEAGLEPHITAMMGYPWESKEDAERTVNLAKDLFKKGLVDTLQATIVIPYPGTPLYQYCREHNLLNFNDYNRFDQREQVMNSELNTEDVKALTQDLYKSFLTPAFVMRKIFSVRNWSDLAFLWRAGIKVLGHLMDFRK